MGWPQRSQFSIGSGASSQAGGFDLILCRNLAFTYLAAALQARIAQRLAECLVAGGDLVPGTHESLPDPPPATLGSQRSWLWDRTRD